MKATLLANLTQAWQALHQQGLLPDADPGRIEIVSTKDPRHGDYACNLALILAREAKLDARELAEQIIRSLPENPDLLETEIAGPGFINFRLRPEAKAEIVDDILSQGANYGTRPPGSEQRILIEYVSANPTGPLHVGHGRGAALGSCLARILHAAGHTVECEYFINDAGRQMDILAISVWLRYLELCGESVVFPEAGYQGDYILDIAADRHRTHGDGWRASFENIRAGAPDDGPDEDGHNAYLDFLILRARDFLDHATWVKLASVATDILLERIRHDLDSFGASFDHWQSERELLDHGMVDKTMAQLQSAGHLYEMEGALWFRSSEFGDEKDRVVKRSNGQWTYFATDIAYHADKMARGYGTAINIWGADHHGYVGRVRSALQALEIDPERLEIRLVQFASLYRGRQKIPMSTRRGEFVTLQSLQREAGRDAARFFYVMRRSDQHLDFDLQLAAAQSADNPVYYVQYAHARICGILERAEDEGISIPEEPCDLSPLTEGNERELQKQLLRYPDVVLRSAREREPHHLTVYLRKLAQEFHAYYNAVAVLVEQPSVCQARLRLIMAVRQTLGNGLNLLNIETTHGDSKAAASRQETQNPHPQAPASLASARRRPADRHCQRAGVQRGEGSAVG